MLQDTISKIESRIQTSGTVKDENRTELLKLLGQLKSEINRLSETNRDDAQSITSYTDISTHEATRETKNPELLEHSIGGLKSSVEQFENTHPQLVVVVNRIATMLANMGI